MSRWIRRTLKKIALKIWLRIAANIWEYTTYYRDDDDRRMPAAFAITFSNIEDWEGKGEIHVLK